MKAATDGRLHGIMRTCRIRVSRAELASLHTDRTMSKDTQNRLTLERRLGLGIPLGAGIGCALGVAWGNIAIGMVIGAGVGILIAGLSHARKKNVG